MSSQDETPPASGRWGSKRSQTVTLVLLASAGATAWALSRVDPSQREEDVLVYAGPDACIAGRVRTADACRRDYAVARLAYPNAAPRYATVSDCESHHGPGHCVSGDGVVADARGRFVPVMAGYVVGRTDAQALDPQPVFDHRPSEGHSGVGFASNGGYCTGWGGRVPGVGGGAATRIVSSAVRPAAFGGFGATGRGFSAHGGSGHGSGG